MIKDSETFNQIALSLARHYECVYYVDLESGHYVVYTEDAAFSETDYPSEGDHFFEDAVKNADVFIHPGDLELMLNVYKKDNVIANLAQSGDYSVIFRAVAKGRVIHMRHVEIMCDDGKHVVFCLENIEKEYREKEEQMNNLRSAELMARRDELTGVKNSNAFKEYTNSLDEKISSESGDVRFGVVMCDINDLKYINDTRGHNFGDEAIQATSRLICRIYQHSPVFRVGGDEFVVVLTDNDYEQRGHLLERLKEESDANRRSRSGPVVASGMAVFEKDDKNFSEVLVRADQCMYENKKTLKSLNTVEYFRNMDSMDTPIPDERRRLLNALFGAFFTVAGGGYIYLNDMRYDFSRWTLSLVDDFGLESEYMYHAEKIWQDYIHPDDLEVYKDAVDAVLCGNAEIKPIKYRARRKDGTYVLLSTRGFVLSDKDGNPEYFGGIIIPDGNS